MTRRDLAALRLAYECVRDPLDADVGAEQCVFGACAALDLGDSFAFAIGHDADRFKARNWDEWRLLRARLATLLRAMLRTDATVVRCGNCDKPWPMFAEETDLSGVCRGHDGWYPYAETLRYTPLWQLAPAHKETR